MNLYLDLSKKLNDVDDSLELTIKYNGNQLELGVTSDQTGKIYSYTTTSQEEAYNKIEEFIPCLTDNDKLQELIEEILEVDMEA